MEQHPLWNHFPDEVEQLGVDYDKFDWNLFDTGFIEPFQGSGQPESLPSMSSVNPPPSGMKASMSLSDEVTIGTEDTRTLDKERIDDANLTKR
jgi:hypothetical protein